METYTPGIDVVVVNYQTPDDLERFLQSLIDHRAEVDHYCSIVNVEAEDADRAVAAQWQHDYPELFSIHNTVENIGYARSCNLGALDGDHDVIALFNADVRLTDGALDACRDALVAHDDWAILGPRQIDDQKRIVHGGILGTPTAPEHRGWHRPHRSRTGDRYVDVVEAVTVSGSAYFVKRSVWDELAACPTFRESSPAAMGAFLLTPHYYEETYCSYHARAHGYKVVYFGEATIWHKWHAASSVGGWAEKQFKISRKIFRDACDLHGIAHD